MYDMQIRSVHPSPAQTYYFMFLWFRANVNICLSLSISGIIKFVIYVINNVYSLIVQKCVSSLLYLQLRWAVGPSLVENIVYHGAIGELFHVT